MGYCFEIHIFPREAGVKIDASKFVAALELLCESKYVCDTTELRHGTEEVKVASRVPQSEIELLMSSDFSLRWVSKSDTTKGASNGATAPPTVPFVYKTVNGETKEQALDLVDLRIISTKDLMLWGSYANLDYGCEKLKSKEPQIACECGFELTYRCNPATISGGFGNDIRMMHSCPRCKKKNPIENLKGVMYKGVLQNASTNTSLDLVPASGYVISMNVSTIPKQIGSNGDCHSFERLESLSIAPEFLSRLETALDCSLVELLTYTESTAACAS